MCLTTGRIYMKRLTLKSVFAVDKYLQFTEIRSTDANSHCHKYKYHTDQIGTANMYNNFMKEILLSKMESWHVFFHECFLTK